MARSADDGSALGCSARNGLAAPVRVARSRERRMAQRSHWAHPMSQWAARVYVQSNRIFRAVHGGAQALFEGFWMGVLPGAAVDRVCELSYGDARQYTK